LPELGSSAKMGWSGEEGEVDREGEVRRCRRWPITGEEDWTGLAARQRWSDRNPIYSMSWGSWMVIWKRYREESENDRHLKKIRQRALDGILHVISKQYRFGRT
jgi:hypothetical protein